MSFTVYKSSAGSGKTFTLVREYLGLVLKEPRKYKRILAITFTNKAANEMKERVVQSLIQIGNQQNDPLTGSVAIMFDQIKSQLNLPDEQLIENAKLVIGLILHNYSDFAIGTIDSFVHRIIRSFAFDLRIPMSFEVELDTEDTLRRIIDLLISKAGSDDELTQLLLKFTQSKTEDEKNWNIEEDIFNVAKLLLDEDSQQQIIVHKKKSISAFLEIYKNLSGFIAVYENELAKLGSQAMELIQDNGVSESAFYQGNRGIYAWFSRFAKRDFSNSQPKSFVLASVEQDKWYSGKASENDKNAIDLIKTQLSDIYVEIVQLMDQKSEKYYLCYATRKNLYPLAILNEIEQLLDDYKSENNVLLISEFNQRISNVVMHEPVPFIYERAGEKYQHYLVDEFQDTSVLQWQNLLPLFENSLGSGKFNMIVGDAKQAIYRWRNGEVEQFIELPYLYKADQLPYANQRQQILNQQYSGKDLKHNYRSAQQLVQFNNEFFQIVSEILPGHYQNVYQEAGQIAGSSNSGGYVEIEFFDKENNTLDREAINLDRCLNIIQENLKLKYQLGDIAILCRNNKHASSIAAHLLLHDIPVVSSESLLLSASLNVRTVISIARLMVYPDDKIARVEIINWLQQSKKAAINWPNNIKQLISELNNHSFKEFISKLESFNIQINTGKLLEQTVYEFCETLIRDLGLNKSKDPYLSFFLDAILDQLKDPAFDLKAMLDWWDHKKDKLSIVVPNEVDAVKVMTIHKSKGLEFPVVVYPFASERVRNSKDKLWIQPGELIPELETVLVDASKQLEETSFGAVYQEEKDKSLLDLVNVLYVAMTRAADRLYVISENPTKNAGLTATPAILKYFLQKKNVWEDEKHTYSFGDPNTSGKNAEPFNEKADDLIHLIRSGDWRKLVSVSLQAPDFWDIDQPAGEQEYGNLIHQLLSHIRDEAQIEEIVGDFQMLGLIETDSVYKIKKQLHQFISHPLVKPYFKPDIKSLEEADVLLPDGELQRPDRVIFDDNNVIVVDYKTGRKSEQHKNQVKKYIKTFRQLGYQNVSGVLLYVFESNPEVPVN